MKFVILAGGSGERFWPLSTPETPKQFLRLFGDKTLLRQTFERFILKVTPRDIYVVTHKSYEEKIFCELPELPKENIFLEPVKNNTACACTFATLQFDKDEIVFVAPADHYIPETENFWQSIEKAEEFLGAHEGIITFGIIPRRVETGYGYIEIGRELEEGICEVKKFHEKPDYKTATKYVNKGTFFWNSGMFMWKKNYFIEQMQKHAPQVIESFFEYKDLEKVYETIPSVSIDYALIEKTDKIYMVKAKFFWSDVGNFHSLKELGLKNSQKMIVLNSENIFAKTTKPTIVIGIKDTVIVETKDGILVCKTDQLDRIKEALRELK